MFSSSPQLTVGNSLTVSPRTWGYVENSQAWLRTELLGPLRRRSREELWGEKNFAG